MQGSSWPVYQTVKGMTGLPKVFWFAAYWEEAAHKACCNMQSICAHGYDSGSA